MKKNLLYFAALAVTLGLASCSSDDYTGEDKQPTIDPAANVMNLAPAKKSEVKFWSNTQNLAEEAVLQFEKVSTELIDRAAEQKICEEVLPEKNGNIDKLNTDFLYYAKDADMELEFYPVYGVSSTIHDLGVFYYDEDGVMHKQIVWSQMNPWSGYYTTKYYWNAEKGSYNVDESNGIKITIKKGYKFGFYWNGNNNTTTTTYYTTADLNEEVNCTDGGGNPIGGTSKIHAGTFVRDGKTYLGVEDWTDMDYQDIVFMCPKEIPVVKSDDTTPTTPEVTPDPTPDPEEPVVPVDPVDPVVSDNGGSVEVNLAINAPHETGDWKESHLSIHVRDTTDVTVFLPVQAEYYCSQDDMMIVQKHDVAWQYNETSEEVSMVVGGQVVTLNITYAENGITVTTKGVTADVLKFCRDNYNDGITFEIRNYYNNEITREDLIAALSNSTVTFLDKAPNVYVNAYGMWEGVVDPYACKVLPADKDNRNEPSTEMSMNNESTLYIYPLKNME